MRHRSAPVLSFFAVAALSFAADPLTAVFEHIDAASKTFKGMTADITNTTHTAIVPDDDNVETGNIKLLRSSGTLARILIEFKGRSARAIALDGHEGRVYNPKTNIVNIYDLASKQGTVNQFFLLGFGATSAELKTTYSITYVGEEKIGAQQASHLTLVPKSADTLRTLKQADLWYAANGLVTQQKLLWPGGDYWLVTYSNMKLGAPPEKDLELKPKGATFQKQSLK